VARRPTLGTKLSHCRCWSRRPRTWLAWARWAQVVYSRYPSTCLWSRHRFHREDLDGRGVFIALIFSSTNVLVRPRTRKTFRLKSPVGAFVKERASSKPSRSDSLRGLQGGRRLCEERPNERMVHRCPRRKRQNAYRLMRCCARKCKIYK
jgi:hypothetical protein